MSWEFDQLFYILKLEHRGTSGSCEKRECREK